MVLTEQEILAQMREIINEITGIPPEEIKPEATFAGDLELDSLSMVEVAVIALDKFGVEIPDEKLKSFQRVQDVIDYVRTATVTA